MASKSIKILFYITLTDHFHSVYWLDFIKYTILDMYCFKTHHYLLVFLNNILFELKI